MSSNTTHQEDIKAFFEKDENKGKMLTIKEPFPKQRSPIHKYCKSNNLKSVTRTCDGEKVIYISDVEFDATVLETSEDEIELFSKYSGIGFPSNRPENFSYFLDLFDRYFDTKKKYALFKNSLAEFSGIGDMKNHISQTFEKILKDIADNKDIEAIKHIKNDDITDEGVLKSPNMREVYKEELCGTQLVSFDIRSANISILNLLVPSFLNGKNWEQYVAQFTDCEFIIKNKYFREVICGKSKIHEISLKRYNGLLKRCFNYVMSNGVGGDDEEMFDEKDIVCICSDELVIKKNISIETLKKIDDLLEKKFPGLFRVESFELERIGGKPFYVKKYCYGEKSIELKHCKKSILCQIIKKYENKPIESIDLEFFEPNNSMMARYLKSVFD